MPKSIINFLWASNAIIVDNIYWGRHKTEFGDIIVAATDHGVCAVEFCDSNKKGAILKRIAKTWPKAKLSENESITARYAEIVLIPPSECKKHKAITIHIFGSPFQRAVWQALLDIPFGENSSYQMIAENAGNPNASRAVGSAVGANPVAVLIPCHRVIHSDGQLGNYHWGKKLKSTLIEWEKTQL